MEHHGHPHYLLGNMNKYKCTRVLYIIEAALEYFFALMLTGAYIAKVGSAIGMSDALVGVLSTASTLGCAFQLFALFLANKKPVKHWVFICHTINQLFFTAVWLIPYFNLPNQFKIVAFMVALIGGWIINHIINSPKISWFMSTVDDRKRGSFTAKKEMVSLISGMIFTLTMSYVIDKFEANGNLRGAFLIGGLVMLALTVGHSLTLIFAYERPAKKEERQESAVASIKSLLGNKLFLQVLVFTTLSTVVGSIAAPFFGTYQINELGFSLTYVSLIGAMYVGVRCVASIFMGRYADKTSFTNMLNVAHLFLILGYIVMIFTTPANGKWMYPLFGAFFAAIHGAGYASGMINIIYDTVDKSQRTGAFALYNAISGLIGFATTLVCSNVVTKIQENGDKIFGMSLYAQQFLSAVTVVVIVVLLIYLNCVLKKSMARAKAEKQNTEN